MSSSIQNPAQAAAGAAQQQQQQQQPIAGNTGNQIVAITEADTIPGFYAARACLTSRGWNSVIACVSDPNHDLAKQLKKEGCDVREYDLDNPHTIKHALTGATGLVLVPRRDFDMVDKTKRIVDVLRQQAAPVATGNTTNVPASHPMGIRGLVLVSCVTAGFADLKADRPADHKDTARMFATVEKLVTEGLRHNVAVVRNGVPMQALFYVADYMQSKGAIPMNIGNGEFAPVNLKDAAHAKSELLLALVNNRPVPPPGAGNRATSAGGDGSSSSGSSASGAAAASSAAASGAAAAPATGPAKPYLLTTPTLLSGEAIAKVASHTFNTEIAYKNVDDHEMRRILEVSSGLSRFDTEEFLIAGILTRAGKLAIRSADLEKLLRRAPTNVEKFFKENENMFKPRFARVLGAAIRDY
ncbi:hypothetical protein H9P43_006575 [Blastocladiella emersonii ATCC 22665]|nr:hypothetical protein H9P43_006575 [Blastocladiella emersonii ATCC 22665]